VVSVSDGDLLQRRKPGDAVSALAAGSGMALQVNSGRQA
jgi:hypothetical protein